MLKTKKDLDWQNLGFGYVKTDYRYVSNYKNGSWDEGVLTGDSDVTINESAGVLQYAQTCFEGLKAYTTASGHVVCFRPDLNAKRMADSCKRLEMPVFPEERFLDAISKVVKANIEWVPPYGSGATLYLRPYMFGSSAVIGAVLRFFNQISARKHISLSVGQLGGHGHIRTVFDLINREILIDDGI